MVRLIDKCLTSTLRLFIILIAYSIFSSCSSPRNVPVTDKSSQKIPANQTHTVARGDTLFSIAWRYGLDYKELAKFNEISQSYNIYPGQKIRLNLANSRGKSSATNVVDSSAAKSRNDKTNSQNKINYRQIIEQMVPLKTLSIGICTALQSGNGQVREN